MLKRFVYIAIWTTLPRQLLRPKKGLVQYIYTNIPAGSNVNFSGKTGRISGCCVCSVWKIVPWVAQNFKYLQNQNVNNVKTHLIFLIIGQNAEILSGGFNDRFSGFQMYWLFMNSWLLGNFFWMTVPLMQSFLFFNIVCRS